MTKSRPVIANSKTARRSSGAGIFEGVAVALALSVLSAASLFLVYRSGATLYQGDAEAHLMIARRIVDSRNAGYDQMGTAWLPLLHLLMLPFVRIDALWRNGVAGAIPPAGCFVAAGLFFFAGANRLFQSTAAAATAVALFALNPNLLYLQSVPMTETVFFAALMALLYFTVCFRQTQSWVAVVGAGLAGCAAALTRYDGWFLLPFVALYFLIAAKRNRIAVAVLFSIFAAAGPLYWMGHNWWMTSDWLDFYRGPYSPRAIQGVAVYPGQNDWRLSWLYYRTTVELIAGPALALLGALGVIALLVKRAFWPTALLALPCLFYIWSLHSNQTPIFIPGLWPQSYYNTRYGTSALPLLALAGAALVALIPPRARVIAAALLVVASIAPWALHSSPGNWLVYEEARVNSEGRRAWLHEAVDFLGPRYHRGQSVITSFYPLTGVLRELGIPLREALIGDNGLYFDAAISRPDLFLTEEWAIVKGGDPVQLAIQRAGRLGIVYKLQARFVEKNEPVIEIYRRSVAPVP